MMINGSEAEKYVMSYSWPNRSKLSEAAIWSINDTREVYDQWNVDQKIDGRSLTGLQKPWRILSEEEFVRVEKYDRYESGGKYRYN